MAQGMSLDAYFGRPASARDRWLGTHELPGYRAGDIIVRLIDLPEVAPRHLYLHLLLLDAEGQLRDDHSGPCEALHRDAPLEERSRFVRVVGELVRHAPGREPDLAPLGRALEFIRRHGVERSRLEVAAQLMDAVSSEEAVAASLAEMLAMNLGREPALDELDSVLRRLEGSPPPEPQSPDDDPLVHRVTRVVRAVGKERARAYLRTVTDMALVPSPNVLGL